MGPTIKSTSKTTSLSSTSLLKSKSTDNINNFINNTNIDDNENNFILDDISIQTSVLNEELLVRGTTNLYVADASAIPIIPNGNVHSTVTIVASMAYDFLRKKLQIYSPFL